jgi:hypothetical protein
MKYENQISFHRNFTQNLIVIPVPILWTTAAHMGMTSTAHQARGNVQRWNKVYGQSQHLA